MKRVGALIAVVVIAGCGTLNGPRTGAISPPTDALARWQDFPADQSPRPIVLLCTDTPGQGFDTNEGKIAYLCGKFALSGQLPVDVPKQSAASWSDGTKVTFPAISADYAFAAMARNGPGSTMSECSTVPPLQVMSARFGVAGFQTDRGTAQMSAWLFTASGARGEFAHPAVPSSAIWGGAKTPLSGTNGGTIDSSGLVLTFSFVGGPPDGPCAVSYVGVVAESPHAVAVAVQSSPGRVQAGPISCTAMGYFRSVAVKLASVLAGRVVVDASGDAVTVCPEAIRPSC